MLKAVEISEITKSDYGYDTTVFTALLVIDQFSGVDFSLNPPDGIHYLLPSLISGVSGLMQAMQITFICMPLLGKTAISFSGCPLYMQDA